MVQTIQVENKKGMLEGEGYEERRTGTDSISKNSKETAVECITGTKISISSNSKLRKRATEAGRTL